MIRIANPATLDAMIAPRYFWTVDSMVGDGVDVITSSGLSLTSRSIGSDDDVGADISVDIDMVANAINSNSNMMNMTYQKQTLIINDLFKGL